MQAITNRLFTSVCNLFRMTNSSFWATLVNLAKKLEGKAALVFLGRIPQNLPSQPPDSKADSLPKR